jgi:hypothetical protein
MEPVTLNERVNMKAVKYLNSQSKAWWRTILKTDKDRKFDTEYAKVKSFLGGQIDGSGIVREYNFADGKTFGRLFDHTGLQGMQKDVRGVLCDGIISDLDIVNCHPMILSMICYRFDISCPNLDYYNMNREKIITDITLMNFDREDAKKLFLKSTNSQWRSKDMGYEFHKQYDAEMKRLQKQIMELPEYNFIKPKVKKGDNELGSFINLCLCYHENIILMKAKEFLESKGIEVCTLAFDGLMHYKCEHHGNELLDELNDFIKREFDFVFKFVYKSHSKRIKVPKDFDEENVKCESYKMMCEEFNKDHAKVGDKYICEDVAGDRIIQTECQFKCRYKHMQAHDKDEQFIDAFVKNGLYTNMRIYLKFDINPNPKLCHPNVYNLWEPFAYSKKTGEYERDEESLNKILHLVKVLANHEEQSEKFLLDWMAQIVQYPEVKSLVPVIQSEEGAGKNTLMDILKELLGESKVWDCTDPMRDIFGTFNDQMKDAFLINLNESSTKDFKNAMGKVRAFVTDKTFTLRAMQQGGTPLPSFHRFILMTNDDFPIPTSEKDRRFGAMQASNELVGNDDFFDDIYHNVLTSENALRTFWDFLVTRDVKRKMTKHDLPNTAYHQELKKLSAHPILQWVEYLAETRKSEELYMNPMETWDSYRSFCLDNNIKIDKLTKRGFETSLSIKNIPGVSKRRGTDGRVAVFDLVRLRKHFNIDWISEIPQIDDPE